MEGVEKVDGKNIDWKDRRNVATPSYMTDVIRRMHAVPWFISLKVINIT